MLNGGSFRSTHLPFFPATLLPGDELSVPPITPQKEETAQDKDSLSFLSILVSLCDFKSFK